MAADNVEDVESGPINPEYLRRNLLVAKAIGAREGAARSLKHLRSMKRAPKWLIASLEGIHERSSALPSELAKYRDQEPIRAAK